MNLNVNPRADFIMLITQCGGDNCRAHFGPFLLAAVPLTFCLAVFLCGISASCYFRSFPPHACRCQLLLLITLQSRCWIGLWWKPSVFFFFLKPECCVIDSVSSVILAGSTHSNPLTLFTLLVESAFHSALTFLFASSARPSLPSSGFFFFSLLSFIVDVLVSRTSCYIHLQEHQE